MDKINIDDFPSLDGVSLIPTKTLQLIIDIYNDEVEKGMYIFEHTVKEKAHLIKEGKAKILCQLDNSGVKEYEIEIEKIYINNNENNKSMLIKVTDQNLLNLTGGIIQGMSGSPIIQSEKFVGAITSVLVNDPQQGYGVFGDILIKQMREAK